MTSSPPLPISLCLTAHNEAYNLKRCLDSIAPWVTEIIVVINDCTDGTDAIAQTYGAKVFYEKWHGYRDQKNIALRYPTQPWILCLDCDEAVSPTLLASIKNFIRDNPTDYNGAYFARRVWFLGQWITHGDWYPDYSLRLIRRGQGHWGGTSEHDKMVLQGKAKKLHGDLYHYSNPSLNHQITKMPTFGHSFLQRQLAKNAKWSAPNAIFRALWRFFRCYIIKRGFLDGYAGFYIAWFQGFSTLHRYTLLYEYEKQQEKETVS